MKSGSNGLTLIEVLVALAVIAIGFVGVAQLQVISMRFSSQAEQMKITTQVAEAEVEWLRQTEITTGSGQTCNSFVPDGYACTASVQPCNAVGVGLQLTCSPGLVSPVAYRIEVAVTPPRADPFILATITTGEYVGGVVGDGSTVEPPATPEPDPDEPEPEDPDGGEEDARPCIRWHPVHDYCQKYGN